MGDADGRCRWAMPYKLPALDSMRTKPPPNRNRKPEPESHPPLRKWSGQGYAGGALRRADALPYYFSTACPCSRPRGTLGVSPHSSQAVRSVLGLGYSYVRTGVRCTWSATVEQYSCMAMNMYISIVEWNHSLDVWITAPSLSFS